MANEYSADVPKGFNVPKQIRLDSITAIQNENALKNLGTGNNLAFKYYEGLKVYCKDEKKEYVWRQVVGSETGLLTTHFVYPTYPSVDGIDYSGKSFNFFLITNPIVTPPDGSETKIISGTPNVVIEGNGMEGDEYVINVEIDGSETKINAGTNITKSGTGTISDPYVINADLSNLGIVKTVNNEVTAPNQSLSIINNEVTGKVLTTKEYVQSIIPSTPNGSETKLEAGDNITITGTGTVLNPYIINSVDNENTTYVNSGDNVTVIGNGTAENPYVISSVDTDTTYLAGTGISLVGNTFNNTLPDQTVVLTGSGATSIIGSYPNFNISSINGVISNISVNADKRNLDIVGTGGSFNGQIDLYSMVFGKMINSIAVTGTDTKTLTISFKDNTLPNLTTSWTDLTTGTSTGDNWGLGKFTIDADTGVNQDVLENQVLSFVGGTGISTNLSKSGSVVTLDIVNDSPDQTVALTGAGSVSISGTYPNFTITGTDTNTTYTAGSGLLLTGTVFSNSAPDQVVAITGSGATAVTGTYPNFTISSTDTNTTYTAGGGLSLTGTVFSVENLQKVLTYPADFTGTNYTLTNADNNYEIIINNGATAVSITVPTGLTSKIGVGFTQKGTGNVTFISQSVTIHNPIGLKIKGQYYQTYLSQEGSTDIFYLGGNTKV